MFGVDSNIIVVVITIILLVLVIKLVSEFIIRLVVVFIVAALGFYYVYFHTDFFEKHGDNKIVKVVEDKVNFVSIIEFQNKFCSKKVKSRTDSITCECVIQTLVDDLKSRFSDEELKELEKDKTRYLKEIIASLKRNKQHIMRDLEKHEATDIWNKMLDELRKGKFLEN